MSDFTLNDHPLRRCNLIHPVQGAASADMEIGTDTPVTGQATLTLPGLSLVGTVLPGYAGVSFDRQHLRWVAGAGGLSTKTAGQHFRQADVNTIVGWLLAQGSEVLSPNADPDVLAQELDHWQHVAGTVAQGLDLLTDHIGCSWWVDADGTVILGTPTNTASSADFDLLNEDLMGRSWLVISTDSAVLPGTTLDPGDDAAAGPQPVTCTEHAITGDSWRTRVRW